MFFIPGGIAGEGELFVAARLAHHVGPGYPFYALKARSAEGKEPSPDSVEEIASDCLKEIRSRQPEGPYTVLGDCAGGVIAYEIAQQLRAQGHAIALLLLMDARRPDASRKTPRRSVGSYVTGLRYHREQLGRLKGRAKLGYLRQRASRLLLEVQESLGRNSVQRSHSRAIRRYHPRPYGGGMTLLVSEELDRASLGRRWEELVAGALDIHGIPGDHHSYIRGNVRILAEKIREYLEKAESAATSEARELLARQGEEPA